MVRLPPWFTRTYTLFPYPTFFRSLGRGPAHALFVGFFGSVLVAMVTRVTQGHSGRSLVMPAAAWFAFVAIQIVAAMRVAAEVLPRSVEHTSELQSLMRISYAVFCLKNKNDTERPRERRCVEA